MPYSDKLLKAEIATSSGTLVTALTVPDATSSVKGKVQLTGQLGGSAASPTVVGITTGATALSIGTIADVQLLKRTGTTVSGVDDINAITMTFDNGSSAITTGTKAGVYVPYGFTILEWTLGSIDNTSGSIVVDVWATSYANFPPTVGNTITASAKPTISSSTKGQSSTLTGWTTSLAAGYWVYGNVDSCTSIKKCVLVLKVKK